MQPVFHIPHEPETISFLSLAIIDAIFFATSCTAHVEKDLESRISGACRSPMPTCRVEEEEDKTSQKSQKSEPVGNCQQISGSTSKLKRKFMI